MLSGDNQQVASKVASALETWTRYEQALPENKLDEVRALQIKYGQVVMVGDGVNDAPALAAADVGEICHGGSWHGPGHGNGAYRMGVPG